MPAPTPAPDAVPPGARSEQERVRREKADRWRERGVEPYPPSPGRDTTLAQARAAADTLADGEGTGTTVTVAGRVVLNRLGGGRCFAVLRDVSGDLQVMLARDRVGEESLVAWKDVDLGDHVAVTGEVVRSRRGEPSVEADSWVLTAKSLTPPPEKWQGLSDPEARVRARHVDLATRPEAREVVRRRAAVLRALRTALEERDFLEVETAVLQSVRGGANARTFDTTSNAFGLPLVLRIALELPLKRLVVGGLERVYEIGRVFRNEGVDATHNPEFTMLESYEAYGDYDTQAGLVADLVGRAARAALGTTDVEAGDADDPVRLGEPFRHATLHDLVGEAVGEPVDVSTSVEEVRRHAERAGLETVRPGWSAGEVVVELFEQLVQPGLRQPTFVRDWPVEVRPLTRQHRDDPRLAEAWDLVVDGVELSTGYTELTDPAEQRRRLTDQARRAADGDDEAMAVDEDFLAALEYGMPPTGGQGLGVDRLVMLLTGLSIRETVTFPMTRPRPGD